MSTWYSDAPYTPPPPQGALAWLRVLRRGIPVVLVTTTGLALLLLIRLIERPIWDLRRPITPWITVVVCRMNLWLMGGLKLTMVGRPEAPNLVANHAGWLDIFALNACCPLYFVAKSEVAGWPGIGLLAQATGTMFIERRRDRAAQQIQSLTARIEAGHRLLMFPEGTSTDSRRVLPFKSSLFGAFKGAGVQPVSVAYHAPAGADPRAYGWWGDMDLLPHVLSLLALPKQGQVVVKFHPVLTQTDRKELAAKAESVIALALGQQGRIAP